MNKEDRYSIGLFFALSILLPIIVAIWHNTEARENNIKNCNKICYPAQVLICYEKLVNCADNTLRKIK